MIKSIHTGVDQAYKKEISGAAMRYLVLLLLLSGNPMCWADEPVKSSEAKQDAVINVNFDEFDQSLFLTKIPNKNTEVKNGALWTHGSSGGKYPPMVYMAVFGNDMEISFRYRHLEDKGWLWFFVDGDDGYGSIDHMLRVKLLRSAIEVEVDAHTMDINHPLLQKGKAPDPISKAYRTNELFPAEKLDLSANEWHTVKLVFQGDNVEITLDTQTWNKKLTRSNFNAEKHKLLWMQNGGEKGIELDDIQVRTTSIPNK
jgi:hypothetical protein